jgi:hypothetical protein
MVIPCARSARGAGVTCGKAAPAECLSLYLRRHLVPQVTRIAAEMAPKVVTAGTRPAAVAGVTGGGRQPSRASPRLLAVITLGLGRRVKSVGHGANRCGRVGTAPLICGGLRAGG